MDLRGLEPLTCWLQISCSANWATSAYSVFCSCFVISCIIFNDSDGNRTRVTAVKGRCLNRLTTEPLSIFSGLPEQPVFTSSPRQVIYYHTFLCFASTFSNFTDNSNLPLVHPYLLNQKFIALCQISVLTAAVRTDFGILYRRIFFLTILTEWYRIDLLYQ